MGVDATANTTGNTDASAGRAASAPAALLPIPAAVLENLAARLRSNGAFLTVCRPDGSVAWHDQSAGVFFRRFVLPLLQYREPAAADGLSFKLRSLSHNSTI